ncbi:type VII toxin-antitoxin system MntA family adenylyltransferase antitoxin [Halomonas mongoliensis]|uniref:type VII toxin-antitoxin system MntA family adenylyltransferase antitoxin n=1 Tax=Halomonas mongoliensis TaxID=321265 RepID=UPI00403B33E7
MKEGMVSLIAALARVEGLDFAVLIGSRAREEARPDSDWDIAIQWKEGNTSALESLARNELIKHDLSQSLACEPDDIDIIDLKRANLTVRAVVAEEGIPLVGEDDLPWMRFLSRTWRDLEHWYLEKEYAA